MSEARESPPQAAEDARKFPCAQCGARLDCEPGDARLLCPYCGHENLIPGVEETVEELDYQVFLEKAAREQPMQAAQRVRCAGCGAETTLPSEVVADVCPYCSTSLVVPGHSRRLIRPRALLPFKITRREAFEKFRQWIGSRWFAPDGLKQFAQSEGKLAGMYLPFWTYDCQTTSDYDGQRGDYYYVTETFTAMENGRPVTRTRQVRHTRWSSAAGTVTDRFNDVLVPASKSLDQEYAGRLAPWDLDKLVPYADEYVSGFRAESYQVDLPGGFEIAKEMMSPAIRATIASDIGGDEQRIHSVRTKYQEITFKHLLLPVWIGAYRFRSQVYQIVINARTGEVCGKRPYSPWKIAAAVLAGLALVLLLILLLNQQ